MLDHIRVSRVGDRGEENLGSPEQPNSSSAR